MWLLEMISITPDAANNLLNYGFEKLRKAPGPYRSMVMVFSAHLFNSRRGRVLGRRRLSRHILRVRGVHLSSTRFLMAQALGTVLMAAGIS